MRQFILFIVFMLSMLPACGGSETADSDASRVEVEDVQYNLLPGGARIVTGQLFNPTEQPIKAVQVQVSLYDADNRRIAGMSILVRDIPPGERKAFREPVDSDLDVQGARVRSVLVL